MTEEKIESQETKESVTTDVVTDNLETAADELLGKVATEVKEVKEELKTETKTKEELELERHKEQSNLGRKVKKLEETLESLSSKLDAYFTQPSRKQEIDEEQDEVVTTTKDLDRWDQRKRERESRIQTEKTKQYETNYVREVRKMSREDEELGEDLEKELFNIKSPFNRIVTGDPIADARINYAEASRAILKQKIAKPKPNVKGDPSKVSTNITVTSRESSELTGLPSLDPFAQEFVSRTKMSEESVKAALGRK